MLSWPRRRRQAQRLEQADAEVLIRDHGGDAYGEARQRERDGPARRDNPCRPDSRAVAVHWFIVARKMGKRVGVDIATRMLERSDGAADG